MADDSPGSPERPRAALVRGLSLLGAVALVVGNMAGTSLYTLAASLAGSVGPLAVAAWGVTALGYLFVAMVYARLGARYPLTGGPYVFVRRGFGEFAGFQTVWCYWFSTLVGNAAIATGVVGYVEGFAGGLAGSVWVRFALAQALLWGLCAVNVLGIRQSARLQTAILFLNAGPLLLVAAGLLMHFDPANLRPFAPYGTGALAVGAALVVWAYSGVESATVPAEEVQSPERTIARGTMIGYALATLLFLAASLGIAGALPNQVIASSPRPLALAAERTLGPLAGAAIGVVAIVAGVGTLNGWILMAGRIPLSAARDGILFGPLARIHPRHGTPHVSLVFGTAVSSAMLFLYFSRPLLGVFEFIVLLAVLTTLLPHLLTAAAEVVLSRRDVERYSLRDRRRVMLTAPAAFGFVLYAMYGTGAEVVFWGVCVMLAGVPVYLWFALRSSFSAPSGEGVS